MQLATRSFSWWDKGVFVLRVHTKFQARTRARLPSGAEDIVGWDTGHPDITGALGLWTSWEGKHRGRSA